TPRLTSSSGVPLTRTEERINLISLSVTTKAGLFGKALGVPVDREMLDGVGLIDNPNRAFLDVVFSIAENPIKVLHEAPWTQLGHAFFKNSNDFCDGFLREWRGRSGRINAPGANELKDEIRAVLRGQRRQSKYVRRAIE